MSIKNIEFKAKIESISTYENLLLTLNPTFIGQDHQIDTYFNTTQHRLKLRQGNIENALIQYSRPNTANAKLSNIILYQHEPSNDLKNILISQLGIKTIVDKVRNIYFIDNVKFHFDTVQNLGTFLEVEAIDTQNKFDVEYLKKQCDKYFSFFSLHPSQIIAESYSDLLLY
jgi:adenylate cyclase, class 2